MECPNGCGETMEEREQNRAFSQGEDQFFIVKDLPVYECSECGEVIIPASSSREIDRLLENPDEASEYVEVPAYRAKTA